MANTRYTQFFYTKHMMPVLLDCNFTVGATGAVTAGTVKGPGVYAVTRLATGTYKVQFNDNYNKFYAGFSGFVSDTTGSTAVGSISPGTVYIIASLGTTTTAQWVTAGVPAGITPAVGVAFLCAATSSGTGTCSTPVNSGITKVEVIGLPNTTIAPLGQQQGGYVIVQTLGATDASTTTLIPKDPAEGSICYLSFYLSNSSVTVQGE